MLREQLAKAKADDLLVPQVVYGYFAANSEGNDVVIWKDDTRTAEWMRFPFRQSQAPYLCIADFFRPADSAEVDYAGFHIVTMGGAISERTGLFETDRYQDYLHLHGLGVEMAEALAEYWHFRIRREWGFADEDGPTLKGLFRQQYRGGRYSWGYPACPDLEDNERVFELLEGAHQGGGLRGDRLPVPARADHLRAHLPPPPGQVLRRSLNRPRARRRASTTLATPSLDQHRATSGAICRPAWRLPEQLE